MSPNNGGKRLYKHVAAAQGVIDFNSVSGQKQAMDTSRP